MFWMSPITLRAWPPVKLDLPTCAWTALVAPTVLKSPKSPMQHDAARVFAALIGQKRAPALVHRKETAPLHALIAIQRLDVLRTAFAMTSR